MPSLVPPSLVPTVASRGQDPTLLSVLRIIQTPALEEGGQLRLAGHTSVLSESEELKLTDQLEICRCTNMLCQRVELAPPATYIRSVFQGVGVGGLGSASSVLLLAYIDFDVDLSTR